MNKPTKPLLISYVIFGVAIAALITTAIVGASQSKPALEAFQEAQKSEQVQSPVVQPAAQEAVQDTPEQASDTPAPAVGGDISVPTKEQGAHIPFTQEPVTPGVPESYVDTVGQCPFYEMAGPKGCIPPPDIECNADWSMCNPVVDQKGEVTP